MLSVIFEVTPGVYAAFNIATGRWKGELLDRFEMIAYVVEEAAEATDVLLPLVDPNYHTAMAYALTVQQRLDRRGHSSIWCDDRDATFRGVSRMEREEGGEMTWAEFAAYATEWG